MRPQRIAPGPGQESVWDYPRPPRVEDSTQHIQVVYVGRVIAETRRAKRVLETSSPPVYYIPSEDVREEYLTPSPHTTFCEWKGRAAYQTLTFGDRRSIDAAWSYPEPTPSFAVLRGHHAFYPGRVDACFVDGEQVRAQAGGYYGGWITPNIVGPFKGDPGTGHW